MFGGFPNEDERDQVDATDSDRDPNGGRAKAPGKTGQRLPDYTAFGRMLPSHRFKNSLRFGMKRQILSLLGVTRQERHKITAEIRDAISAAGGWIADHSLFSNIAVTIRFSLPPQGLDELQRGIASAGVTLDDASLERLRQAVGNASDRNDEIDASMNITFIHDEPDLRREVPAIPG